MSAHSLLHIAVPVVTVAVDVSVLIFSFVAYRRTQMRAFAFLIGGSAVRIILVLGVNITVPPQSAYPDEYRKFVEFTWAANIISVAMLGIGIILLIQHILAKSEPKPPNS